MIIQAFTVGHSRKMALNLNAGVIAGLGATVLLFALGLLFTALWVMMMTIMMVIMTMVMMMTIMMVIMAMVMIMMIIIRWRRYFTESYYYLEAERASEAGKVSFVKLLFKLF